MRLKILCLLFGLIANCSFAKNENANSAFQVIPLNSPVKENVARFLLKAPKDINIVDVKYMVKNASKIFEKEKNYSPTKLIDGSSGKELHIPVSSYSNGFYRLFVRVRTKDNASKAKSDSYQELGYKNVYHDYIKFVVDTRSSDVPEPDPVQNNATLLGIDTDSDGVRDDVQNWINKKTSNSDERLALRQLAVAENNRLLFVSDKEKSIAASHLAIRAQRCHLEMQRKSGASISSKLINNEMDALFTNTRQRIEASFAASRNFHGETVESSSRNADLLCDF